MSDPRQFEYQETIVVVDDNQSDLHFLTEVLASNKFHVRSYLNGVSALQEIWATSPMLILLAINLKSMDAFHLCRQLKEDQRSTAIPIIFLGTINQIFNQENIFTAQGNDYILKPFHTEEILTKLNTHLSLILLKQRLKSQNLDLQKEINERKSIENELQQYQGQLEQLVEIRTTELKETNEKLHQEIFERKQIEKKLQEQNRFIDTILENTPIGYAVNTIDDGQIVFANNKFSEIYGVPQNKILTVEDFFEIVYPDIVFRQQIRERILTDINSGDLARMQWENIPITTQKGEEKFITATNIPLPEQNLMISTVQDVTKRQQIENALRESEFFLKRSQAVAQIGSYYFDIGTGNWISSPTLDEIFGIDDNYPKDTEGWLALIHPDHQDEMSQHLSQNVLIEHDRFDKVYRITRPVDGQERWVHGLGELEFNEDSSPVKMIGTIQDITDRKLTEEALQLTQFCVDHASIGIFLTAPEGEILSVNEQACSSLGYTREELTNMNIVELNPAYTSELWHKNRQDLLAKSSFTFETEHQRKDGTIFPVEISVNYVKFKGEGLGFSFVRDITERKRSEAAKKELEEQLRQAQKLESIGRLAGGIAHDFNNLLVPILGYAELGQMNLPANSKVNEYLEKIRTAAERASSLTSQILAFSRRQMLEIKPFDLNEIIMGFQEMLKRLIGENIELKLFLSPRHCIIKADRTQIEQILLNLSINARDAMFDSGQLIIETENVYLDESYTKSRPEIEPGNYVMLSLSDTGHGMDDDTQKHIFEPFFTTKEQNKGTGLGLATVFGIVKQHQGNIWVYSELGKGTTFKIYLPRSSDTANLTETTTPKLPSVYGTETVLVMEDEPLVRKLACETLDAYGYTILEAESFDEAFKIASTHEGPIHLLLTDVIMPDLNGREAFERLAEILPSIKVLYMSGYTSNVIVHHGVLDEGVNFLQKPFTVRDLAQKVRRTLD